MNSSEVISKPQLTSMIHFLEERDEASKKLDEQLKVKKKSHQPSDILHQTSEDPRLSPLASRQKIIENYKFTKQNTMINVGIIGCGFVGGAGSIGSNIQQTK